MVPNVSNCPLTSTEKGLVWYAGIILISVLFFKLIRSLWRGFYTCILADLLGMTVNWKKLGSWAVITGATDGIGKAYAKALAAKGFNIVLISRNPDKLKIAAEEIEKKHAVQTKIIPVDFTAGEEIYNIVASGLAKLDIGVLVNNVGMSYEYPEYLTKVPDGEKFAINVIKANLISCIRMTQIVLPEMENRRKGVIINLSSLSALSPMPLLSIYSGCKIAVNYFTRATQDEYRSKGIIIQSVLPGFVATKMSKMRPGLVTCSPEVFVRWALKTVGVEDQTYGYPIHKLQGFVQELLCLYVPENINLAINHRMLGSIRKRFYRKKGLVDENAKKSTSGKHD